MTSHSCDDYIEQIVYLIDDELDAEDVRAVRDHLEQCGPCLEKYDVQRTVKSVVARSCAESAPDGLRDRIRLAISQVEVTYTERRGPGR